MKNNDEGLDLVVLASLFEDVLDQLKFDLDDPNFKDTPHRMSKVYEELLYGHTDKAQLQLQDCLAKVFPSDSDEMVVVREIDSVGVCPHHMLPVLYTTHVAYVPRGEVIGLSKIPRIVKLLSSRAVIQETLVSDIADTLMNGLSAYGVAVHTTGVHTCAKIRGVKSHSTDMVVCSLRGCFKEQISKMEFFTLIFGK